MNRLPDFEAWAVFAKVAETGSFARAAAELGLSRATVSKAVARLEARLGARLFHRSSRRLALSEAGRVLAGRAAALLAGGEEAEAAALAQSAGPRGRLRLTAPMTFGMRHLAPALPDFMAAYPDIALDLTLSDRIEDLIAGGYDAALRIAALPDSRLVARRLCGIETWTVAAPAYLARHGRPARPRDLARHACFTYAYSRAESWRFADAQGGEETVAVAGPFRANNGDALVPALVAGHGIALLPDFIVWREVADGRLERILPGWSVPQTPLQVVMPPGGPRPPKVAVLLDFLVARFSDATVPWREAAAR
jgi:DNA-binding transcriptional LysR family regulator